MIVHNLKVIYFHIGKTAGTSVEKLLDNQIRNPNIADYDSFFGFDKKHNIFLQHASAEFVKNHVSNDIFDHYYKFSVVRNPFERLVSVFFYLIDQNTERFGDFDSFIHALPELNSHNNYRKGSHFISQTQYTHLDGNNICDHIAHFEYLPQSLDQVCHDLKINNVLGHHNKDPNKKWKQVAIHEYFNKHTIKIVCDLFEQDFINFGYSFDPTNKLPEVSG